MISAPKFMAASAGRHPGSASSTVMPCWMPMPAQGFEHVMDEGEAREGRRDQVDHRHIREQGTCRRRAGASAAASRRAGEQFALVGVVHQGVVAKGALVEPAGERDRDQQAGARNQPQRQRHHQREQEQHAGDDGVHRAAQVGAAAALLDVGVVAPRDALEHQRQATVATSIAAVTYTSGTTSSAVAIWISTSTIAAVVSEADSQPPTKDHPLTAA
jgi:hypothetical protein